MWLPDFVLLLNHFGGNLVSSEKTTLLSIPKISIDYFFIIASKHLRSRTRVTTCFFNLLLSRVHDFNPDEIQKFVKKRHGDPRIISAIALLVVDYLKNIEPKNIMLIEKWSCLAQIALEFVNINPASKPESFFRFLPLPKKCEKHFLEVGLAYSGFDFYPKKHLKSMYLKV